MKRNPPSKNVQAKSVQERVTRDVSPVTKNETEVSQGRKTVAEDVRKDLVFTTGFSKGFKQAITLNTYPNGISVTIHKPYNEYKSGGSIEEGKKSSRTRSRREGYGEAHREDKNSDLKSSYIHTPVLQSEANGGLDPFFLRTKETRDMHVPEGKFLVYRDAVKQNLESIFQTLAKKKLLGDTIVYLGVFTDAFHGFHRKFAQTMACLEVLERYQPGRVVIQSRSRMLLTALPTLKAMSKTAFCVIPFESRLESSIARYTPGQPRLEERLVTAAGLRAQGVGVTFSVSPILPYGETSGDLWKFAEVLISYSDRILAQPLYTGEKYEEATLRQLQIAKKLENEGHLKLLRPHAEEELLSVIKKLSPSHLKLPELVKRDPDQLALFAA